MDDGQQALAGFIRPMQRITLTQVCSRHFLTGS